MTELGKNRNWSGDIMATFGSRDGTGTGVVDVAAVIILIILTHLLDYLLSSSLNELYPCKLLNSSSKRFSSFWSINAWEAIIS